MCSMPFKNLMISYNHATLIMHVCVCVFQIYLKMFPKDQVNPIFCLSILNSTQIFNFKKVYENSIYSVLYLIK
jgi:hypothetical protein